ncbi:MAG: TonB-dependent receptor [Smithellaceae bacterium]|nr:TonB-dependent receptor [Smithellaceae bacterium]
MVRKWNLLSLILIFVLCLYGASVCSEAAAAAKDFETYTLGEVLVTANKPKVEEMAIDTVVTAEDIAATSSHTVAEALANAPGVRVTTGRKNAPGISIHGFDQSRILTLIDGVPYYETYYGKLDLNQIPVDNIAKIEVIKGAASVLYGANNLGGVINIVTKKAAGKPFTSFSAEASENETHRISVTNGMKKGIFSYWINYAFQESDGWNLSDDFTARPGSYKVQLLSGSLPPGVTAGTKNAVLEDGDTRNNSDFRTNDLWVKLGVEPQQDSEYYVNLHYLNKEKGSPSSTGLVSGSEKVMYDSVGGNFSTFARMPKYLDWGIDLDGKQKITEPLTLKAKAFYHHHIDDYASYSDPTYQTQIALSRYEDYVIGTDLMGEYQPVEEDIIRAAFHYKGDSHKQRSDVFLPYDTSFGITSSFDLENEYNGVKDLSVVTGIGYNRFEVTRAEKNQVRQNKPTLGEIDALAGANYKISGATKVYASLARKTRFPTLSELFGSMGTVDLKPEKSLNYTAGVAHSLSSYVKMDFALFHHDVTDMISKDAPGAFSGKFINYANVKMFGAELAAEAYPCESLSIRLDYTYNYARNFSDDRVSNYVTFTPEHKADLGIEYTVPKIATKLCLNGLYMGRAYSQVPTPGRPADPLLETGDYTIFDVKIVQGFLKHYEAYVAANNVLDANYEQEAGFPAPGRAFWVGLSAKF